jgi:hypothetical protein
VNIHFKKWRTGKIKKRGKNEQKCKTGPVREWELEGESEWRGWRRVNKVDVLYILVGKHNNETCWNYLSGGGWAMREDDGRDEPKQGTL